MLGTKPRIPGIICPHCQSASISRTSSAITDLCRELRYRCTNEQECGHVFVAQLAITHSVIPSRRPNPVIHLPLSTAWRPANDVAVPVVANDAAALALQN